MDARNMLIMGGMVVGALIMIIGATKGKSGAAWGNLVAIIGVVLALGCAIWSIVDRQGMKHNPNVERIYEEVSAQKLGAYLAEKFPNKRALVIVHPQSASGTADSNPRVDGLRKGFGDKIVILDVFAPKIPEEAMGAFAPEMLPAGPEELADAAPEVPMDFWFTAKMFDEIVEQFIGRIDIIVSTVGLPQDMADMSFWRMQNRPELVLLGGEVYELKNAIAQGAVRAAVSYRPDAEYSGRRPPTNVDDAFDKRFVLITSENVQEVAAKYGQLFR